MNISMAARAALAGAALAVAAGCTGGSQVASTPLTPVSSAVASKAVGNGALISPSGRLFKNGLHARVAAGRLPIRDIRAPKDLFVALNSEVAVFQNKTWGLAGTITATGMSCPDGDWIDKNGNLYVDDWACGGTNTPGIYEFKRGASTPSFVYTAGLTDPVNVRTDKHGNVYVMDFYGGYLDEYKQGTNSVLYQCAPPNGYGLVVAAAVDKNGDVFMANTNGNTPYSGYIYEYAGGLKGCNASLVAVFPFFPGGMVLDKNQNLVLVDQDDDVVDVLPPPYTTIGSQISAYDAFMVTINRRNDQIYVTGAIDGDEAAGAVYIDAYPSGSNIATLGASSGIDNPGGAVDALNYIP
jgi:hypothetical protein